MLLQVLKKMEYKDENCENISKEGSDIMSHSNEIENICERSLKDLDKDLREFNMTSHSKSSVDTYFKLKRMVEESISTIIRIKAINDSIPKRVTDIEKTLKKLDSQNEEV